MLDLIESFGRAFELGVGWIFSPSWLPPKDFELFRWLIIPGFGYGLVLVGLGILELVIPHQRRPWSRDTLLSATYLLFAGKLGLYAFVIVPLVRNTWVALGIPSLRLDETLPLALYMPLAILVLTFVAYWAHRLMHRVPLFWNIHKIHHSVRNLNFASVYHVHLLETLLQTPGHLIVVLSLGTNLVAPFGIIFKLIDVLGHSNVRVNLGWLTYFISTPQAHRVHHSADPQHYDTNFGNTFMLWDHLFGTFCYDPEHPPTEYGVGEAVPTSFVKQQVIPLVAIARSVKSGVSRLLSRTSS